MRRSSWAVCGCALAFVLVGVSADVHAHPGVAAVDDVASLTLKLKDPSEDVRRGAVADLAKLDTAAAWTVVVDALADPSPRVADEAQTRLASIDDAASMKAVWGKSGAGSKDPLVLQRVAEAIGRMQVEVDGVALSKLLGNKDAEVRRTAARALERLALENKLEKKSRSFTQQQLDQAIKNDKDPDVRAAALPARHALAAYTVSDLFGMLSKRDAGVVRGSVSCTLADVEFNQVVGLVDDTLEDEEACTARVLVDLFRARKRAFAADSLANILGRYRSNQRVSWAVVDCLREWSGLQHGPESGPWKAWAKALPDDWRPPDPPKVPVDRRYPDRPALLGQPVISCGVGILVDSSEWILTKRADGSVQKAWLKAELAKLLADMPERSEFNIVPYGNAPAPCEKALVPLKPETIKHALKAFDESAPAGKDSFLDAAWLALADPRIDTILVITDSAPAGSQHVDPELILEQFEQRNRFLRVVLDVILLSTDADVEAQWRRLAAPTGGRVTKASL